MSDTDPHAIRTEEALREVIGSTFPGLELKNQPKLDEFAIDFIARSPLLVLSTSDAAGNVDASPKGDAAGFVSIEDEQTILIPDRPGNKLVYGHLNVIANPKVGVLFLIPGTPETLRVNGTAELTADPALLERLAARGKPATLAIRVHVEECFFHCAKAFIRSAAWKPETWPDRVKVSFGRMLAKRTGADESVAEAVDNAVETDYRDNL
ncbi:MAG: pyridoxamine 5'-phosphate oxidase family protein [Deltaproteobacteria bacterium]|nr:pyridoxamine 5'-phosphate oxidase family protein [Deltaproteobacteria bacterium]MBW2416286.1 pyridoxamine 5'-phosphate oxidase family protein [Deltaproteobacteria bacterium]